MNVAKVALVGNPNVGKTSLFNALTGSRHSVGNYAGITVDIRQGPVRAGLLDRPLVLIDLPGIYSTTAVSDDERLAFAQLSGRQPPDAVVIVVDATNLARNLYLVLQVLELGLPCVIALNMSDMARAQGHVVDVERIAAATGVPCVATVGRTGQGGAELLAAVADVLGRPVEARLVAPGDEHDGLREALVELERVASPARARWLLSAAMGGAALDEVGNDERDVLDRLGHQAGELAVEQLVSLRYREVDRLLEAIGGERDAVGPAPTMRRSVRADRVLTHPLLGLVVFGLAMTLLFQGLFSWSDPFIGAIESLFGAISDTVASVLGPGLFTDLVTQGVIAGAGNVIVFVPQIALLFVVLGLLEDSGYLARAAFLLDRLMTALGLSGKAFVPLLSGYACAIPAIMGTRTIAGFRQRLAVILMIPYMSCSARLPVYALVIGALFEADRQLLGPFTLGGLLLVGMYLLSTVSALIVGGVFQRVVMPAPRAPLVLELPPYRLPRFRNVLGRAYDRTMDFVRDAGTVILAVTVVLWALLTFPRVESDAVPAGETVIEQTVGGRLGKAIEPALEPIGQDWRIGVGLIGSFAAREVLVSTLGLVYGIEAADEDDEPLRERLRNATDSATGERRYTPLKGLALMVFFVYACQCMSTLAVVKRETGSWKWPMIMLVSMTVIAYVMALVVYQGGRLLGSV